MNFFTIVILLLFIILFEYVSYCYILFLSIIIYYVISIYIYISFFILIIYMMTIKQYIINIDVKLKLFDWAWATKDTEKYRIYNALLDNFLSDKDIAKLKFRPKILFMWHLYCGALQDYTLNGRNEKLNSIIKRCPLSKRELETLFS